MCKRYSEETKQEIINLSNQIGVAETAKRMGLRPQVIHHLRYRCKDLTVPLPHSRQYARIAKENVPAFTEAKPKRKREKTGIITEEVIRTIIREKRNQYGEDERKEALILSDMLGAAEAARETGINLGTINGWRARRAAKAKAEEAKRAAEEKENFFKETIVKLTQRVSALEAVIKSKFEKEKMA